MDWHDDVAAALPDPEVPEPPSLRRDLVDEIADHLHEALAREQRADVEGDEETVRARVLERFGDTRSVLRQLWFDALKERLVTQRIITIAACVLAVASLVACGLAWSVAQGVQQANRDLLEESRKANAKLLAMLTARDESEPVPTRTLDWNPLGVELVAIEGGGPLAGWSVSVRGHAHAESEDITIEEQTDERGRADFGMVRPGSYVIEVTSPLREETRKRVTVRPGRELLQRIECPTTLPPGATADLKFQIQSWDSIRSADVGLLFGVRRTPREVGERSWSDFLEHWYLLTPAGVLRPVADVGTQQSEQVTLLGTGEPLAGLQLTLTSGSYIVLTPRFVRMPKDGLFPEQTPLAIVAPTEFQLRLLEQRFPSLFAGRGTMPGRGTMQGRGYQSQSDPPWLELPSGKEDTTWTIEAPRGAVVRALTVLTGESLDGPIEIVKVYEFHVADENGDGAISAPEYDKVLGTPGTPNPSADIQEEWPLDARAFVDSASRPRTSGSRRAN